MQHEKALAAKSLQGASPGVRPLGFSGFDGRWKNELGSTMDITIQNGRVTGVYTSTVSGGGGGTVTGDITGFVDDDIISFIVKWTGFSSMTAWVGQVVEVNGVETIKTLWHLLRNVADAEEPAKVWSAILTGADQFTR
jgi:hypothetical protein